LVSVITSLIKSIGLASCPREERADDVCVDDVREGIALFRELANVVPHGLTRFRFAALEVPGVSKAHVRPLEIPKKELFELCLPSDAVGR
jgi:hypothetical protein